MSKNINKTIIIGRINSIGALTTSIDNKKIIKFDIKNSTIVKDIEQIEIYSITALNKEAEAVSKYLNVGDLCCVEGCLSYEHYEHTNKQSKNILAEHITFLCSKQNKH